MSLALLISGCALFPTAKPVQPQTSPSPEQSLQAFNQHAKRLAQFDAWALSARVGVKSPQGAYSGNLEWIQNQDNFSITVSGPLGQGTSIIEGTAEEVTLTNGKTGEITRGEPTALMNQALGWSLPMDYLKLWIKGHPGTAKLNHNPTSDITLNNENTLALLNHANWHLEYSRYQTGTYNIPLPHKVVASNPALKLTFIIKNWSELQP
ncbi:MAG TPA: lipoprotein insertase outer membrane protein LolB [Pseudomonadales bacterium]